MVANFRLIFAVVNNSDGDVLFSDLSADNHINAHIVQMYW